MTRGRTTRLEQAIDGFAAAGFALCTAWSVILIGTGPVAAAAVAVISGVATLAGLRRVGMRAEAHGFDVAAAEFDEPVEDILLLEDPLLEPAENSQVVRLFAVGGERPVHGPGELASRIDQFLEHGRVPIRAVPPQPDAAQELYDALAEIRRTLR